MACHSVPIFPRGGDDRDCSVTLAEEASSLTVTDTTQEQSLDDRAPHHRRRHYEGGVYTIDEINDTNTVDNNAECRRC